MSVLSRESASAGNLRQASKITHACRLDICKSRAFSDTTAQDTSIALVDMQALQRPVAPSLALYACARECGGGLGNPQDTATRGTKSGPIIATPCHAVHDGRGIDVREFMKLCLAENDRRRDIDDRRLLRPMFVPRLVRVLTVVLGLLALKPRHRRSPP